ncbi:MAG: hypothetical protein KAX49_07395 [Halanaerobiales bacterium]|nr:hypothetical protein [Halanaerobiales bacterium]
MYSENFKCRGYKGELQSVVKIGFTDGAGWEYKVFMQDERGNEIILNNVYVWEFQKRNIESDKDA